VAATLPAVMAGLVAVLCGLVAGAAWRVLLRTGNRAIAFVVAAFALLSLKSLAKALVLAGPGGEADWHELVFSVADLVAVALIAWPLLLWRPRHA
jgi:hypothetical protein